VETHVGTAAEEEEDEEMGRITGVGGKVMEVGGAKTEVGGAVMDVGGAVMEGGEAVSLMVGSWEGWRVMGAWMR